VREKETVVRKGLRIGYCKLGDLNQVQQIEDLSFKSPYPLSIFRHFLFTDPLGFRIARLDEEVSGYCITSTHGSLRPSIATLASIAVRPELRRRGIGEVLLEDAIRNCKENHPEVRFLELQVSSVNLAAKAMYSKFGFKKIALISRYYEDGEDADVMELDVLKTA
jgi:ribosomal-protein-alanine N-acetyltransferase